MSKETIPSPLRGRVREGVGPSSGSERVEMPTPIPAFPLKGEGVVRVKPITKKRSRRLRKELTDAEKKLWKHLRKNQLECKFRRQHPIGRYIVDFACLEKALVIELDGGQHAMQQAYDAKRNQRIEDHGYTVLRFWNNEVMENFPGVYEKITSSLEHQTLNTKH